MATNIDDVLHRAVGAGASDIHLKVGSAPIVRVDGVLRRLDGVDGLRPADTQAYAEAIFTTKAAADFEASGTADFAYGKHEIGRFRVTAFRQRGSVSLVLRRVVPGSKTFAQLGVPKIIEKISNADSGLVLITGPSGSGKTTTISSMIDWINSNRGTAVLTVEDPIEVLHPDKRSVVVQREVGVDTPDMATAIRGAMRHDTDVIMVSEISNYETAKAAIDAAEAGHLVISSMRTSDPAETVTRLVSMFPESAQQVVRSQIATQIQVIVSQLLVDTDSGPVLACEVLTSNERAQEWILGREDSNSLVEIIKESGFNGMQTFDQALLKHVVDRSVAIDSVVHFARNSHEMKAKALAAGISG
ncbi:MAG: PilT/PilU family type 4a pilus ATPase [Actinomycetota bacterium]|nr:PilT/PilU family type 4a pilus ATPase [Actinomycetota bacterium]